MKNRTPQDASLRALAVSAVTWGGDTNGQLLRRALLASILVTHHGIGPVTATDLVEHQAGEDEHEMADAYDKACIERKALLDEAAELVNAVRYADYDNDPELALDGAA